MLMLAVKMKEIRQAAQKCEVIFMHNDGINLLSESFLIVPKFRHIALCGSFEFMHYDEKQKKSRVRTLYLFYKQQSLSIKII